MSIGPNDTVTSNYGLVLPQIGGDVGTWGGIINSNLTTLIDAILGNVVPITLTSTPVTIDFASQWQQGGVFAFTGLTANVTVSLPLSPNSTTTAVKGRFIVANMTSGAFTLTINTVAAGSTGVVVPQGQNSLLYSDGTNVYFADNTRAAKFNVVAGNPVGSITGNAGNPTTQQPADSVWDSADQRLFVSLGGTAWTSVGPALPMPGGYLTPSPGNPVIGAGDTTSGTVYYSAFRGNQVPVFNGSSFSVLSFGPGDLQLPLTTGIAANAVYDVYVFIQNNALQIGYAPWGGLNARSIGVQRVNGILVNSAPVTLTNTSLSGGSFAVPLSQATYVASFYTDTSGATVTLNGNIKGGGSQARWGIWNNYHRQSIVLQVSDPNLNWTMAVGTWRPANNNAFNAVVPFCGMPEEIIWVDHDATVSNATAASPAVEIGLGLNSTTAPGSPVGIFSVTPSTGTDAFTASLHTKLVINRPLGVNTVTALEENTSNTGTATFFGTTQHMLLAAHYNG